MPDVDLPHAIDLCGRRVAYRVRRSARARGGRVRVGPGDVCVVLPARAAMAHAPRLMRANARWVVETLDAADRRLAGRVAAAGLAPGRMLLRGAITPVSLGPASITAAAVRAPDAAALAALLRRTARRDLSASVDRHRGHVARPPFRLSVRDGRTRWGSCSSRGTLSFSFRIVMAPPATLDYLVVHELVHLDHPNHSPAFWRRVRDLCPDLDVHERWLREHEAVVMRPLAAVMPRPAGA